MSMDVRARTLKGMMPLLICTGLLILPELALAQGSGGSSNPIQGFLDGIVDLLNNGVTRSAAILVVMFLGFRAWRGHMEWSSVGWVLGGMLCVFAPAAIVDWVQSNAGI
ncbi:TrbC/VirB2 family protein [Arhodomonas sp. AD133]|uniref:TrbC/VirB2 family protein n=1 Tax=Arhodomonas sp. AD133 TaxID=3415009 RepID=UPI003EB95D5E